MFLEYFEYAVYLIYIRADNTVVYTDDSKAVTAGRAVSNVRKKKFGKKVSMKYLKNKRGIKIVAARYGTKKQKELDRRAGRVAEEAVEVPQVTAPPEQKAKPVHIRFASRGQQLDLGRSVLPYVHLDPVRRCRRRP